MRDAGRVSGRRAIEGVNGLLVSGLFEVCTLKTIIEKYYVSRSVKYLATTFLPLPPFFVEHLFLIQREEKPSKRREGR